MLKAQECSWSARFLPLAAVLILTIVHKQTVTGLNYVLSFYLTSGTHV